MKKEQLLISIQMMGRFVITVGETPHDEIMSVSPKGLSLIEILILEEGRTVRSDLLTEELWPQEAAGRNAEETAVLKRRAVNRLKTLVCRTREYLNQLQPGLERCIFSGRGGYAWKPLPFVSTDVDEIKTLCTTILLSASFRRNRWRNAEKLIRLFRNGLYLTGDLKNGEQRADALQRRFQQAVDRYLNALEEEGDYYRLFIVCREGLKKDPDNQCFRTMLKLARDKLKKQQVPIPEEDIIDVAASQLAAGKAVRKTAESKYARMRNRIFELENEVAYLNRKIDELEKERDGNRRNQTTE